MELQLVEKLKGPKPMIPVDWIWGVDKFLEDKAGAWYVEGYCSTHDLDLVGDMITKEASQAAADQLVGLTLLYNHNPDEPIGTVVASKADDKGIWVKCLVSKTEPKRWEQIKESVLNKFSIRLLERDSKKSQKSGRIVNLIKSMIIKEISLTSLPANPRALAGMAYVGKSFFVEGNSMEGNESLEIMKSAVDKLLQDYKDGKLADIVDDLKDKQDATYGYGSLCPFYGNKEVCPVLKSNASGDEAQKLATACENSKIYTCPYLQLDYSAEKYPLPAEGANVVVEPSAPAPALEGQKSIVDDKTKAKDLDGCPCFEKPECQAECSEGMKAFKAKYPKPGKYPEPGAAGAEATKKKQLEDEAKLVPEIKKSIDGCPNLEKGCPYVSGTAFKSLEVAAPPAVIVPALEDRVKQIETDQASIKMAVEEFKKFSEELLSKSTDVSKSISEQVAAVATTVSGLVTSVKSLAESIKSMKETTATELKAAEVKIKSLETLTATRKGLPAEDDIEDLPGKKKDFWGSCFPI